MQSTQIKRVSIREFNKNICKYLKELPIQLTRHGIKVALILPPLMKEDSLIVGEVATIPEKSFLTKEKVATIKNRVATYGCGCKREDSRLCQKHQRV